MVKTGEFDEIPLRKDLRKEALIEGHTEKINCISSQHGSGGERRC